MMTGMVSDILDLVKQDRFCSEPATTRSTCNTSMLKAKEIKLLTLFYFKLKNKLTYFGSPECVYYHACCFCVVVCSQYPVVISCIVEQIA